jgi:hypothetical protein|uniref:hypothetical protein n=1 Tax=Gelidibacter sp. TaxID=2018083 RepID=UPI00404A8A57
MGFIKDAIKAFDGTPEAKQELEVQLDNMTALANAKADYFKLKLTDDLFNAGAGNSKDIPIKFIIDFARQTHSYASSSADAIASTITDAISDFITGGKENVMKGVGSLMTKAVQLLFASKEGGEDETHFTSVFAEGRALVRLDLMAWKRYTNVKSLSESAEQISAFVICKSTINAEVLDYNTFIQLYQKNLYEKASGYTAEEISQQLDEIDDIYKKFLSHQKAENKMLKPGSAPRFNKPSEAELAHAKLAVERASLLLSN